MTIEHFRTTDFHNALPKNKNTNEEMCNHVGVVWGEHSWTMPVKDGVQIFIHSSIAPNGHSADYGENSIRAWLADIQLKPLGSKVQKYITRTPGWQNRLTVMLRKLYMMGVKIEQCPKCKKMKGVYKQKKAGKTRVGYSQLVLTAITDFSG